MGTPGHSTMEYHPDILELRARHERAAATPQGQGIEATALITGLYLAASPWIVGFNGVPFSTLAVNNLIVGIAYAVLMSGYGQAYERTHSMAWAAAILGVWTIIAPWVVAGRVDTTRTIINNIVVGAVATLLALAASMLARMRAAKGERRGPSPSYGAPR